MRDTTLLIIEDDHEIRALLADFLGREGFAIETVESGAAMERVLARMTPDLVVLDIMLPGEDGLSICRRLRGRGNRLPILMLTVKDEDIDRIVGLEVGADDYLGKPFNPRELLARIRALLRRVRAFEEVGPPLRRRKTFGGLTVDLDARRVESGGVRVPLTSAEFDLLACFVERPHRVLSRDQLLDWTRGRSAEPFDRTIDVTVSRLRAKLGQASPEPRDSSRPCAKPAISSPQKSRMPEHDASRPGRPHHADRDHRAGRHPARRHGRLLCAA